MRFLAQFLTLYTWGVICILLLFLFRIALFFERRRQKKTAKKQALSFYQFLLVPIIFFAVSAVLYALSPSLIVGRPLADSLRIIGALFLGVTGYVLLNTMIGGRS